MPTMCQGLFPGLFFFFFSILRLKTMNVSVRMTRTLLLMPEPHGQNQQRNGTKPPTESGTLLMYLEVGH